VLANDTTRLASPARASTAELAAKPARSPAMTDEILAEIAEFLSAHRDFLDRYLAAAGGDGIDDVPDDAQPG
jgi:hypothetical protein